MEITVFADVHAHAFKKFAITKSGINSRLQQIIDALQFINQYNEQHDIARSILAGDLFHTFGFVDNDVLNLITEVFQKWFGQLIYIPGNHDLKVKVDYQKHSTSSFILDKLRDRRCVYLDGKKIADPVSIYGLGWREPSTFYNTKFEDADIFVGHQLIENSLVPGGMPVTEEFRSKYKFLIFGDIHQAAQPYDNVLIPGAPIQHNFGDEGQKRGFWVLDTKIWKARFVQITTAPVFFTVDKLEDVKDDFNYYRVRNPIIKGRATASNVIVQEDLNLNATVRDRAVLDASMSDAALVNKYIEEVFLNATDFRGVPVALKTELAPIGLSILQAQKSEAVTPTSFVLGAITVQNFLSFQGKHLFVLAEGLHLLSGKIGSGKSSLWEAVYWALLGETTKGLVGDDILNDVFEEDALVQLMFHGATSTLIVERYRKSSEHGNTLRYYFKEDGKVVQRESVAETEKEVLALLGTNKTLFKAVNYFSQEDFAFFSTLADTAQKDLCKVVLPLDRILAAEEEAKRRHVAQEQAVKDIQILISQKEQFLADKQVTWEQTEKLDEQWVIEHNQMLASKATALNTAQQEEVAEITQKDVLMKQLDELQKQPVQLPPVDTATYDAAIVKVSNLLDELRSVNIKRQGESSGAVADLRNRIMALSAEELQHRQDLIAIFSEIQRQKFNKADAEEKLAALNAATCPILKITCEQLLATDATKQQRDALQKVAASAQIGTLIAEKRKEAAEKAAAMAAEQLKRVQDEFALVGSGNAVAQDERTKEIESVLKVRAEKEQAKQTYIAEQQQQARLAKQQYEHNLILLQTGIREATTRITIRRTARITLQMDLQQLQQAISPHKQTIEQLAIVVQQLHKDIAERQQQLVAAVREEQVLRFWLYGFGNQGLVSYLLDGFAQSFTKTINDVLLNISNGQYSAMLSTQRKLKSGEYREKFEFIVYIGTKRRLYKALSGGQKARINFATMITLNRLVQQYYGLQAHPLGLLVLDELFTALDEESAESVYYELEATSKKTAVYVITHKLEVKSMFSSVIDVTLTDRGTQISF